MSPSHPDSAPAAHDDTAIAQPAPVVQKQPLVAQPMNPQQPHSEEMGLRGGDGNGRGMCPGRFCFIIPCPIPCNFCVFPCPC
ncbi:hypothetical protein MN608_11204 [Microdochium nivale]|nr:hypothetical protein MN608_11204 [Microdochium nivale]